MKKIDIKMMGIVAVATGLLIFSYIAVAFEKVPEKANVEETVIDNGAAGENELEQEPEEKKIPKSINGLLVGFDVSGGLTDVIMVGHLDTETNDVKVISIPRDLLIDFRNEEFKHIKENNPNNRVLYCKLNEVYSNVGWDDRALQDVKEIVSVITGLEIDYVTSIDVHKFVKLVDIVDGVEFDVPRNMYYNDPVQNLHINLKKGPQLLDGKKAEGLVRFRSTTWSDLQRIQMQQEFMVALSNKILSIKDFSTLSQLAKSGFDMFEADFGIVLALEYAEYFFNLNLDEIMNADNMITITNWGERISDQWFQLWDKEQVREEVKELLDKKKDED